MDKYIGKLLDNRYEVKELIGTGGMANVYKARCTRLCRHVAIKILKDEFASDPEFKRRFKNESNAVARLSHKNIVNVYDISTSGSVEYIVMELIEGITLKEYLYKKEKLDWKQTLFFAFQIAEALEHAHSRGIIHQDIKPQNIMLLRDGTLKVADFGIAKLENEGETQVIKEAIGSVHYISPEQARGSKIDSRTDIYSLGVVMYEMITGRTPFKGDSAISIVMQHINALPVPPSSVIDDYIPKALEFIIEKAMCPSLKRRYVSAKEMIEDIEKVKNNPEIIFINEQFEDTSDIDKTVALNFSKSEMTLPNKKVAQNPPKKAVPIIEEYQEDEEYEEDYEPTRSKKGTVIAVFIVLLIVATSAIYAFSSIFLTEPNKRIAPNLVNKQYVEVLEDDNLKDYNIEITEEIFNIEPKGTIIQQQPKENVAMLENEYIYVTVSKGPKTLVVPDVSNFDYTQAEIEFRRQNIEFEIIQEYSEKFDEGKVTRTEPMINEEITEDTIVTIFVSAGMEVEIVTVPSLDKLTIIEAKKALETIGLLLGDISYETSLNTEGTVIAQDIKSGTETISGTKISIIVSKEPDEPSEEQKTKIITVNIPQDLGYEVVLMEVFADNELIYGNTHGINQGSFTLEITGTDSKTVYIYADNKLVEEIVVVFN